MYSSCYCPCWRIFTTDLITHLPVCFWNSIPNGSDMFKFAYLLSRACGALWKLSGWSRDYSRWAIYHNCLSCNMHITCYANCFAALIQSPRHFHVISSRPTCKKICDLSKHKRGENENARRGCSPTLRTIVFHLPIGCSTLANQSANTTSAQATLAMLQHILIKKCFEWKHLCAHDDAYGLRYYNNAFFNRWLSETCETLMPCWVRWIRFRALNVALFV